MIDIVGFEGGDLRMQNSDVPRAANILMVQLGALEYAPQLGVDLAYFLSEDFSFQNSSFQAYLVQRLAEAGINVSSVTDLVGDLSTKFTFNIDDSNSGGGGLMAR